MSAKEQRVRRLAEKLKAGPETPQSASLAGFIEGDKDAPAILSKIADLFFARQGRGFAPGAEAGPALMRDLLSETELMTLTLAARAEGGRPVAEIAGEMLAVEPAFAEDLARAILAEREGPPPVDTPERAAEVLAILEEAGALELPGRQVNGA